MNDFLGLVALVGLVYCAVTSLNDRNKEIEWLAASPIIATNDGAFKCVDASKVSGEYRCYKYTKQASVTLDPSAPVVFSNIPVGTTEFEPDYRDLKAEAVKEADKPVRVVVDVSK